MCDGIAQSTNSPPAREASKQQVLKLSENRTGDKLQERTRIIKASPTTRHAAEV
jgi:hypothetical protein